METEIMGRVLTEAKIENLKDVWDASAAVFRRRQSAKSPFPRPSWTPGNFAFAADAVYPAIGVE